MTPDLPQTISLLSRFPFVLNALLRDLPDALILARESEDTWNAFEIVAHLIDSERHNWIARAMIILRTGEGRRFAKYDRNGYLRESQGKTLDLLLDEFARVRAANLKDLQSLKLQSADMKKRGIHPGLGVVTLSQLLATWAAHDLTHLHQLSRVLAHPFQGVVGPWEAYLGVMKCNGHSDSSG